MERQSQQRINNGRQFVADRVLGAPVPDRHDSIKRLPHDILLEEINYKSTLG